MIHAIEAPEDGGNIIVRAIRGTEAILEIRRDEPAAWAQWFHMVVDADPGDICVLRIANAGQCSYPEGWADFRTCVSEKGTWTRTQTDYDGETLIIRYPMQGRRVSFAYFEPYPLSRLDEYMRGVKARWPVDRLGATVEGRDILRIRAGNGPFQIWLIGRQHSGETMASWWMEGALDQLDSAAALLEHATVHIVPLVNMDGVYRGNLRGNAAGVDLNRQWHAPEGDTAPEVAAILNAMDDRGVDLLLDVHGDETTPHVFIDGCESIPNPTEYQLNGLAAFHKALLRHSPCFQTRVGYPVTYGGDAASGMASRAVAARFGAIGMTLEMPFIDSLEAPDQVYGWSASASQNLGRDCIRALQAFVCGRN